MDAAPDGNNDPAADENNPISDALREIIDMDVELIPIGHFPDRDSGSGEQQSWEEMRAARMAAVAATAAQSSAPEAAASTPESAAEAHDQPMLFDTELPDEHSYLGTLDRVSGVAYLEPNRVHRLPVLCYPNIIYPGEQVPMILSEQHILQMGLRNADNEQQQASATAASATATASTSATDPADRHQPGDGFVFGLYFEKRHCTRFYGVTVQVYEMGTADRAGFVRLKTRAQQRFEVPRQLNEDCAVQFDTLGTHASRHLPRLRLNVRVLPEVQQPDALFGAEQNSWSRFRQTERLVGRLRDGWAQSRPWPRFVYDQYDVRSVMKKVKCFLSAMDIQTAQMDPVALSFWCAKNVLLRESQRWDIFKTNSVTKRMLIISRSLDYTRYFVCCQCYSKIAHFNALFAMSKQGIQTNFCNPAGYIHETNTVFFTVPNAVHLMGQPCTSFSWFPGYAWQIASCAGCSGHLGWKFTAAAGNDNLVPKKFYGLSGGRILIRRYVRANAERRRNGEDDDGDEVEEDEEEGEGRRRRHVDSEHEHVDTEDGDEDDDDEDDDDEDEAMLAQNAEQFLSGLLR